MLQIYRSDQALSRARRCSTNWSSKVGGGEYIAIVGESGSGKSTLLNLIAGLDRPDAGSVVIDGVDIAPLDDDARTLTRRSKLGFVFQAFHILPHLTVEQNVTLPLVLLGEAPEPREQRAAGAARRSRPRRTRSSMPRELSGGELQRVAVARALVHQPALVLADEPTGNLDPGQRAAGAGSCCAREIRSRHAAGVLVTHSEAAAATADRVLRLHHGKLIRAMPISIRRR